MHSDSLSKNTMNGRFTGRETCRMFSVVSSHVPTLKHEAKHGCIKRKCLFVCFVKGLKDPPLGYISVFL